jgi:hypothetical protein
VSGFHENIVRKLIVKWVFAQYSNPFVTKEHKLDVFKRHSAGPVRMGAARFLPLLLAMVTLDALACSTLGPPPTVEENFAAASAVFVAHITKTEEILPAKDGVPIPVVAGTFRVLEVLKGMPPADNKVESVVFGPGNCSVPLLAGWDYVFFLRDGRQLVSIFGTESFFNIHGTEPKKLLEKLRQLKP